MKIMAAGSRLCFRLPIVVSLVRITTVALFVRWMVKINSPCMAFSTSPLLFPYLESTRTLVVPSRWYQRKESKSKPSQTHQQTVPG
jgi:hypothetical protein